MRILLVGGEGQVGHALRQSLAPLGLVVVTTRNGRLSDDAPCELLDLTASGDVARAVQRPVPDIVVNAAAWAAVDTAETERDAAFRAKAGAVEELAHACAERDVRLVHYSTGYVFDGRASRPYLPTKAPCVVPITTAEYPTPATRPAWSLLDAGAPRQKWKVCLPEWREALSRTMWMRQRV